MLDSELDRRLNVPFTFKSRPAPLPGDMRPTWRMHVLVLMLDQCWAGKATHQQLHVLNWAVRTEESRGTFIQFVHGHRSPNQVIVRYDPSLNRAVNFACAEGIVSHYEDNPELYESDTPRGGSYRVMLTKKGRELLRFIRGMEDCLVEEKEFLNAIGKKVTQQLIASLFNWSDGT